MIITIVCPLTFQSPIRLHRSNHQFPRRTVGVAAPALSGTRRVMSQEKSRTKRSDKSGSHTFLEAELLQSFFFKKNQPADRHVRYIYIYFPKVQKATCFGTSGSHLWTLNIRR